MSVLDIIVITLGLSLFEIVSSIDNAVINADVLSGMGERARRWFLVYGIFTSVFLIRGLLPLVIVYLTNPAVGFIGAFAATFRSTPDTVEAIEMNKPILLAGGGIFLLFLFLHWLFDQTKNYAYALERLIHQRYSFWFYSFASVILVFFVWATISPNPVVALGAVIGSSAFFITTGFKENAAKKEQELKAGHRLTDISKIIYLEIIDATFSVDGVLGAFAFTISVPLILLGNGIGAFFIRYVTIHGIETVKKYMYIKNGAMYSIGALGVIMMLESLHIEIHPWISPIVTFTIIGWFFYISKKEIPKLNVA